MAVAENLSRLAASRKSDEIIIYFTGDRNPPELFPTQIAPDVITIFDKHLYKLGKKKKISLFLYTSGGLLEAPWPIVSLFREYCEELEVIIPYKALSAGTLVCLGADKIVMTPLSVLSPIDPQGSFRVGQEARQIQVEDVTGFVEFAKSKVGIAEQSSLAEVMKILSSEIPPSVLGSVNRAHSLIRLLADKLLRAHKNPLEEHQIKSIVESLTEKLFTHTHLIGRVEAKEKLGFKDLVEYASDSEEKLIRNVYAHYEDLLKLKEPFEPGNILGERTEDLVTEVRAIIESSVGSDKFTADYKIEKIPDPASPKPFAIKIENVGWKEDSKTSSPSKPKPVREVKK